MKYAVTGGAGFIGSHLVKNLVEHGDEIIVIDNLNTGKKKNIEKFSKKIDFFEVDIRDFNAIEDILKNIDGIFHEAALASVQDSFRIPDEFFDVNVKGTENIFKIGKKLGIKVVYASSSSVYGTPISIPIKENDNKNPFNPYANIIYAVPENTNVKVTVYDLNGRQIAVLKNEFQTPGYYSIQWDASQYSSGVYFVEMLSGDFRQIRQVLHMK